MDFLFSEPIADGEVGHDVLGVGTQEDGRGSVAHGVAHEARIRDARQPDGLPLYVHEVIFRNLNLP